MIFAPGFLEERFRQQANDVVAFDKLPFLIEQEAAVEVAVKGDTHIGAVLNHRVAGVVAAPGSSGLGIPFEVAVWRVVHLTKVTGTFSALKRASSASTTGPAAPLPELITSFSGLRFATLM